jgi:hypothetical protein
MTDRFDKDGGKCGDDEARVLRDEAEALEHDARDLERKAHDMEDRAHELEDLARKLDDEHGHHDGGGDCGGDDHGGGHGHDAKVKITLVVNGQGTLVEAGESELLGDVRQKALEQTHNLAQPAQSWEIKTEAGELLDPNKKVGEYDFGCEVTLFLSLAAGVAGV